MNIKYLVAVCCAVASMAAHGADSINLGGYSVTGNYVLANTVGSVSGLEASAVTYARDRGTLFFVGDEGTGVVEISRTGAAVGSMAFNWAGTGSTNNDAEGLTYVGGGVLVVGEERLYDAFRFTYAAGGTATLASSFASISNVVVGNNGMEGISYDPRDGSFVAVKQQSPQDILAGMLTFAGGAGGTSTMTQLFNPALMGVTSLSDVQTLSPVDALTGTAAADNLLVLSLASNMLLEVNRAGVIKSSFNLAGLTTQAIEGVTVDENGAIYLVAEDSGTGNSRLFVLTAAPVPEPETWGMMLAGLGVIGMMVRRRKHVLR